MDWPVMKALRRVTEGAWDAAEVAVEEELLMMMMVLPGFGQMCPEWWESEDTVRRQDSEDKTNLGMDWGSCGG
jgi:hypothetical protein